MNKETTQGIYSLDKLKEAWSKGHRYNFIFFLEFKNKLPLTEGCLSLYFPCQFIDKNRRKYSSCIQYMMAQKAIMFKDNDTLTKIMNSNDPSQIKQLGHEVKHFNPEKWDKHSEEIVYQGNLYKFDQNQQLNQFLLSYPSNTIFAESNPRNGIWGINLDSTDPRAKDPLKWGGLNKLGFQITKVRDLLLSKNSNNKIITYAYEDTVNNIFYSEEVESIDLISSGVTEVILDNYPNLKQLRVSKCFHLKRVSISNMPNLQVVDLLDNRSVCKVSFNKCPKLTTLDVGFCPSLAELTGIDSLRYLSAPSCYSLNSIDIPSHIIYLDITNVPIDVNRAIHYFKDLECLTCATKREKLKLSEITSNKSLKILYLTSTILICDSITAHSNLKIIIFNESSDINDTTEGNLSLLNHFYVTNRSVTNKDINNFDMFDDYNPEYQKYQKMLYGPWGIPKVDLYPRVNVTKPIICPPEATNQIRAADSILGSLFGSAVFDMIGVGVEFIPDRIAKALLPGKMNITWSHPRCNHHNERFVRGTPTDDTSQCILILRSIVDANTRPSKSPTTLEIENVKMDPCDFGQKLKEWIKKGHEEHKNHGGLGIGATTLNVVKNPSFDHDPIKASRDAWVAGGRKAAPNGSVMRIASSGCFAFWNEKIVVAIADCFAKTTHYDPRCIFSSIAAALLIARYIQCNSGLVKSEPDIDQTLEDAKAIVSNLREYEGEIDFYTHCKTVEELNLSEEKKIGYCLKAFGSAVWALRYCNSIEEALVKIIREGGDSDTNGAVVGAILGAKFGFHSIPHELIEYMFVGQWLYKEIDPYMKLMGIEVPPSPYLKK